MLVTISYFWGPYRAIGSFGENFFEIRPGLNTMRITIDLSCDKMGSESVFVMDCAIQALSGMYFRGLAHTI